MTSKVMVSFPDEFLSEIDRIADEEHRSRSELLREAMRLYMSNRRVDRRADNHLSGLSFRPDEQQAAPQMERQDKQIARELRKRLASLVPLIDLRVFGSRARGDFAPDSDLDVFIEVEAITPEARQMISDIAWELGYASDRVISTVVVTREQLEHGPISASPLLTNVEREGVRP